MRRSLSRTERLKRKSDFARVFSSPDHRSVCRGARLIARRSSLPFSRFAPTLVRNFGNSVERNHARRVLKEIYRNSKMDLPQGYDIVIVLYPGAFSFAERENQFSQLIRRARLDETGNAL